MRAVTLIAVFVLTGCTIKTLTPAQLAELDRTRPQCSLPQECAVKWSAARRWLLDNASMKIQVATEDLIETYNPTDASPGLGIRIVKEVGANGVYKFSVNTWCDNVFGCRMSSYDATKSFNDYVNSSWNA